MTGDNPAYTVEDINSKRIVCATLDVDGRVVRKDSFENSSDRLQEYIYQFHEEGAFVKESKGFYDQPYDFMESDGFSAKLANPVTNRIVVESRMKNHYVISVIAKVLRNSWIPESYVLRRRSVKSADRQAKDTYKPDHGIIQEPHNVWGVKDACLLRNECLTWQ